MKPKTIISSSKMKIKKVASPKVANPIGVNKNMPNRMRNIETKVTLKGRSSDSFTTRAKKGMNDVDTTGGK